MGLSPDEAAAPGGCFRRADTRAASVAGATERAMRGLKIRHPAAPRPGRRGRTGRLLVLWAGAVGIGCAAVLLAAAAGKSFALFEHLRGRWPWWPFLALPLGGLALTWFMRRVGPGAEGSGIQQAIAALEEAGDPAMPGRLVNLRLAAAKFAAITGGMGSGFVLGLEGPTVQIGASIFYSLRRFFPHTTPLLRRQLILAGGAAGIAAAFNAPLAGLIFAFEEMSHSRKGHTPAKLAMAIILAGVVAQPVFGYQSYFGRIALAGNMPPMYAPLLALLAVLGGLAGGAFTWLALRLHLWVPAPILRMRVERPYLFVACCGILIAVAGLAAPIYGSGAETTRLMLDGRLDVPRLYLPCKFAGLLLTFATGLPGGIFSPSLSIGAGLGSWFLPFVESPWHGEFLTVGMTAVLAGVTRAPMTAAFILIEMTDGHAIVLAALGAAFLAEYTARFFHVRFYHELAARIVRQDETGG